MVKCVVKVCQSRSEKINKASGITFHKIPKDRKRMEEWTKVIRLLRKETDWLPSSSSVICSKHFRDGDKILAKKEKGRIRLSEKAVPMVIDQPESVPEMERIEMGLDVETDEEMLDILDSPRTHKMKKTIKRLKFISSKRLKCIKSLKEKNKRLNIKNKKMLEVIKDLKNKRYISEEEETQLNINEEMKEKVV